MKNTIRFLFLVLLLALAVIPSSAVFAQGEGPGNDGKIVFGQNFTLKSGDTFNGDLVVFGGNVTIEKDASLNGDLVVFGGTVSSDGTVHGDIVIVGGQASLDSHAVVTRDVVTVGGQLSQAEGAEIQGEVVNNAQPALDAPISNVPPQVEAPVPSFDFGFRVISGIFQTVFNAILAAGFAMLLALFWKPQMERAGDALVAQPVMVGAIGLLAVFLGAILFLTVIPPVVVGFALLFGTVALGAEVGDRFTRAINQTWSPALTAGFGTFLLVLVAGAFGEVPCVGWLAQFLLALLGIGAAIVTWFGIRVGQTQQIQPSPPSQS